ncbi:MAG: DUF2207 domain-containing protein [Sphaerochaetaceae bacterium]
MKRRLLFAFIIAILAVPSFAQTDYAIPSYTMDVAVNDANVYSVSETIDVDFSRPRHGIYRFIPVRYGKKRVELSDLRASVPIQRDSVSDAYVSFRLGDPDLYVSGAQRYVIGYTLGIGDDGNPDYDEVYYDLLGSEWECPVNNFSFVIHMPHPVDQSKIWVVTGTAGGTTSVPFTVSQDGMTVSGTARNLGEGKGLNLRIELPEGYFASVVKDKDETTFYAALALLVSLFGVLLAWWTFSRYGRDDLVVPVVRFEVPEGLSPMDVGYLSDGSVDAKDLSSMLFYWADNGCLTITILKKEFLRTQDYVFTKVKEPEGASAYEKQFFDAFFRCGSDGVVHLSSMKSQAFAKDVMDVKASVRRRFSRGDDDMKDERAERKKAFVSLFAFVPVVLSAVLVQKGYRYGDEALVLLFGLVSLAVAMAGSRFVASRSLTARKFTLVFVSFICLLAALACFYGAVVGVQGSLWSGAKAMIMALCVTLIPSVIGVIGSFVGKRSPYGVKMMSQMLGYREFIATAKIDQLKVMIDRNPSLYYHVLSYAIVFGLEKKWARKFDGIMMEQPAWYYGPSDMLFNVMLLDSMIGGVQNAVARNLYPQSTSTAHGPVHSSFGGGGFVGGGFGGGGGGAW